MRADTDAQAKASLRPPKFRSTAIRPHDRGLEFGRTHAAKIARTVCHYRRLFREKAQLTDSEVRALAAAASEQIDEWAPTVGSEIRAIAAAAQLPHADIVAINARTEILAHGAAPVKGECSTVVHLGSEPEYPEAQQNWDWYELFTNDYLKWSFKTADGRNVETLTEYGIVAKIGCNDAPVGILFNILHHESDGGGIGVPVHIIARRVLEEATDVAAGLALIASAKRSASTAMTLVSGGQAGAVAVSAEVAPNDLGFVFADDSGLLVHTNHFLTMPLAEGDLEHRTYPDTVLRYDSIRRALRISRGREAIARALSSRVGGPLAVCCQPDGANPPAFQFKTLAHVRLNLVERCLEVSSGGPQAT